MANNPRVTSLGVDVATQSAHPRTRVTTVSVDAATQAPHVRTRVTALAVDVATSGTPVTGGTAAVTAPAASFLASFGPGITATGTVTAPTSRLAASGTHALLQSINGTGGVAATTIFLGTDASAISGTATFVAPVAGTVVLARGPDASTLVLIYGYLYDPQGNIITGGRLSIALQSDMVSVNDEKVVPFLETVDLADSNGLIQLWLVATEGASPPGTAYRVWFDPNPDDTETLPMFKDGYFENVWAIPHAPIAIPIGNLASAAHEVLASLPVDGGAAALSGTARASAGSSAGYIDLVVNGTVRRIEIFEIFTIG